MSSAAKGRRVTDALTGAILLFEEILEGREISLDPRRVCRELLVRYPG